MYMRLKVNKSESKKKTLKTYAEKSKSTERWVEMHSTTCSVTDEAHS